MVKLSFAAIVAATTIVSSAAFAQEVTTVTSPETVTAPVYGSGDVVVAIPQVNESAVQTIDPVEYVETAAAPDPSATLDMTGADGSLRACYSNGGIAKQLEDFSYVCNYEKNEPQEASSSAYTLAQGEESSYQGTTDIVDDALLDCVKRGGTLIQLAANEQFACAM